MQRKVYALEDRLASETMEKSKVLQERQSVEVDVNSRMREQEERARQAQERLNMLNLEHDNQVARMARGHDAEKESIKKDYECLLKS